MHATINEPQRPPGSEPTDPLAVLVRVVWGPGMVYNVVASRSSFDYEGRRWWVTGLEQPCSWGEILEKVIGEGRPPYAVEVVTLPTS